MYILHTIISFNYVFASSLIAIYCFTYLFSKKCIYYTRIPYFHFIRDDFYNSNKVDLANNMKI